MDWNQHLFGHFIVQRSGQYGGEYHQCMPVHGCGGTQPSDGWMFIVCFWLFHLCSGMTGWKRWINLAHIVAFIHVVMETSKRQKSGWVKDKIWLGLVECVPCTDTAHTCTCEVCCNGTASFFVHHTSYGIFFRVNESQFCRNEKMCSFSHRVKLCLRCLINGGFRDKKRLSTAKWRLVETVLTTNIAFIRPDSVTIHSASFLSQTIRMCSTDTTRCTPSNQQECIETLDFWHQMEFQPLNTMMTCYSTPLRYRERCVRSNCRRFSIFSVIKNSISRRALPDSLANSMRPFPTHIILSSYASLYLLVAKLRACVCVDEASPVIQCASI